jgi:uncharacterized protein YciI
MQERLEFIYVLRSARVEMLTDGPTVNEAAAIGEHFAYLQDLTAKGVVVLAGRTTEDDARTFGVVVFRAGSEADARRIMDGDPAVRQGAMSATLHPFRIALLGSR